MSGNWKARGGRLAAATAIMGAVFAGVSAPAAQAAPCTTPVTTPGAVQRPCPPPAAPKCRQVYGKKYPWSRKGWYTVCK